MHQEGWTKTLQYARLGKSPQQRENWIPPVDHLGSFESVHWEAYLHPISSGIPVFLNIEQPFYSHTFCHKSHCLDNNIAIAVYLPIFGLFSIFQLFLCHLVVNVNCVLIQSENVWTLVALFCCCTSFIISFILSYAWHNVFYFIAMEYTYASCSFFPSYFFMKN